MVKQLLFAEEARTRLQQGMNVLATAVATTLGPKGRNAALDKKWGAPTITHDGVTVAREIGLKDPFADMGVQLLKQAAIRTNDIAGDGTTTATILAHAMVNEGLKNVAAGANPMLLKQGVLMGADALSDWLRQQAISIDRYEEIAAVAAISAQDPKIGALIAQVMERVGKDGVITIEESQGLAFETEYVEGMQIDRGYISPYFITEPDTMEAVVEDAYILLYDKKITAAGDLIPILEKLIQRGARNLVVIAEDVGGEALATLVLNKLRGTINALAVKAPGFGDRRKAMLQDMAILSGAQVISEELGRKLETVQLADLGRAAKVIASKDETTIVEGQGDPAQIKGRVEQLKLEIERTDSDYDREKLQERMAKLAGGVAIIRVGAATETELKEKKHRVEDALSATRAAVEEGIVPGGGVALLNARCALEDVKVPLGDMATGVNVLREALFAPMRKLAENAGYKGDVVVENVLRAQRERHNGNIGFDVLAGEYLDMVEAGIIDPVKVTRGALENAASIAAMILSTEALVAEKRLAKDGRRGGGAMPDFDEEYDF